MVAVHLYTELELVSIHSDCSFYNHALTQVYYGLDFQVVKSDA
jgi:hypothetical protein